jgi:hypothetical protein
VRINSLGTPIGAADRAFARASKFKMRDLVREVQSQLKHGYDRVARTTILQTTALALGGRDLGERAIDSMISRLERSDRERGRFSRTWPKLRAAFLKAMRSIGERQRLTHLIAPVRPSAKEHYPLSTIDRYVRWRREDGQLFDPWMRIHERLGARVSTPLPKSLQITGTVDEWESWTAMVFPETGDYVFPEGLAPVHIDRSSDRGIYWEPNVWMVHEIG